MNATIFDDKRYVAAAHALVLLLCIPLFFVGLGNPPLLDPDEPVYAATGKVMLLSHHFAGWWSPHYNGSLWFDKPPMTYWLIALSMKCFGINALAARVPSAISGILLVVLTAFLTKRLFPKSPTAGVWAAVALSSSLQTIVLARAAVTDMILAVLLLSAMLGMWNWLVDERQNAWLMTAGFLTGLAVLTKGPVAIVLVGGTVLFYLLLTKQALRLRSPWLWIALFTSLAVSLPWYLSMVQEHGTLFVNGFLEANNLTRYLSAEHPQTSSIFWFFPVLIGFIFPWSVPFIFGIGAGWAAMRRGDRGALFAIIWIVWVFAFFSASQTKLPTYIYPLYPLAASLIGLWLDTGTTRRQRIICGTVFATIAALIAILLPEYVSRGKGLSSAKEILDQIGIVFAVFSVISIIALTKPFEVSVIRSLSIFAVPAACMALFFSLIAMAPLWKQAIPDISMPALASLIQANSHADVPTIAVSLKKPSLVFYSTRNIIFVDDRRVAAQQMMKAPYPLCVVKNTETEDVVAEVAQYLPKGHCKIVLHYFLKYVLIKYQP